MYQRHCIYAGYTTFTSISIYLLWRRGYSLRYLILDTKWNTGISWYRNSYTSFLHIRSMHKAIIFLIEYCNSIFAFKLKFSLLRYLGRMIGFVWIWWCVFCRNIQTIMLSKIDTIGVQQIFWTPCYESRNKMVR